MLANVLQNSNVLENLHLADCRLTLDGFDGKKFTDALAQNTSLWVLSLQLNYIGHEGAKHLADAQKKIGR